MSGSNEPFAAPAVWLTPCSEGYWPVNKSAFDRVAVDVANLFDALLLKVDVEVVVTALPELFLVGRFELAGGQLLEDLEKGSEGSDGGFVGEEMDVLRHQDVGRDAEFLLLTGLFEDLLDAVFCGVGFEEGVSKVTTEGDEVEVPRLLVAPEAGWHGGTSSLHPTLRKSAKDGAPEGLWLVGKLRVGHRPPTSSFR